MHNDGPGQRLEPDPDAPLGDYVAFFAALARELDEAELDVSELPISHLGYKAASFDEYHRLRDDLLPACDLYVEDVHNGRPIAKLILRHPLHLAPGRRVRMVELMPPKDRPARRLGLEHVGFVLGDDFPSFVQTNLHRLTGRQDQGPYCQPAYVTFPSGRRAKFYDKSLRAVLELEGQTFLSPPVH